MIMINYNIIEIPQKYWLDVKKFDYKKFNYGDIKCIYHGPRTLIKDFEEIDGFVLHAKKLKKKSLIKKKSLRKILIKLIT